MSGARRGHARTGRAPLGGARAQTPEPAQAPHVRRPRRRCARRAGALPIVRGQVCGHQARPFGPEASQRGSACTGPGAEVSALYTCATLGLVVGAAL